MPVTKSISSKVNVRSLTNADIPLLSTGSGGTGAGTGFFDPSDMIQNLEMQKAGANLSSKLPNQILDSFSSALGTYTNVQLNGIGELVLSGSNLSGSYERVRQGYAKTTQVQGVVKMRLQQLAPANVALSPSNSASSVTFTFSGDVSNMFSNGATAVLCTLSTSDGEPQLVPLKSPTGEAVEMLTVSGTPSYSSGPDQTTVVVSNPDGLDLSMGFSSSSFNASLRLIPFAYTFQAKSLTSGTYANISITDWMATNTIGIIGENYIASILGLSGSNYRLDTAMSQNGTYMIARALENNASTKSWHFAYSNNGGNSWTDLGTRAYGDSALTDEFLSGTNVGATYGHSRGQLFVANNGKAFWAYAKYGAQNDVWAVYADLSGSPTLTDTAATGTDALNVNAGSTPGALASGTAGQETCFSVDGDYADGSFIAIYMTQGTGAPTSYIRFFTAGGSVYSAGIGSFSGPSISIPGSSTYVTKVGGTGSSHYAVVFYEDNSTGNMAWVKFNQGSYTAANGPTALYTGNLRLYDIGRDPTTDIAYLLCNSTSGNISVTRCNMSTFSAGSAMNIFPYTNMGETIDTYGGFPSAQDTLNFYQNFGQHIIVDPANVNHIFTVMDINTANTVSKARLWEIYDTTAYQGQWPVTQYTVNDFNGWNASTALGNIAQTFTAGSNRLRSVGVRISANNTSATAWSTLRGQYTITCEIQTVNGGTFTPTNTPVTNGVSTVTYDPGNLIKTATGSASEWVYFTFDGVSLTNGVTYAIVLKCSAPASANNGLMIAMKTTGGASPNLTWITNDAPKTNWVTHIGTAWQWAFEINGEWVHDHGGSMGLAMHELASIFGAGTGQGNVGRLLCQETGMSLASSTSINLVTRRTLVYTADSARPLSGHPYRSVITIGNGTARSAMTQAAIAGYRATDFDPALFFNVSCGNSVSAQKSLLGVVDNTKLAEDRSGLCFAPATYNNIVGSDFIADSSFQSGQCLQLNGSNKYMSYSASSLGYIMQSVAGVPMIIEAEIKGFTAGSIFSQYSHVGGVYGWTFQVNSSGQLTFLTRDTGAGDGTATSTTGFLNSGYWRVRVTTDGSTMRLFKNSSPTGGTWTEASYATQTAQRTTSASPSPQIGRATSIGAPDEYGNGKVGYVKFARGVNTFVADGFRSQPAITRIEALGNRISGKQYAGTNASTLGTNFATAGIMNASPATPSMVDSYDVYVAMNQAISTANQGQQMNLKALVARASTRDVSGILGLCFRFVK